MPAWLPNRPIWVTGSLSYDGANAHNYNPALDILTSPLAPYVGRSTAVFRCTADPSYVVLLAAWAGLPAGTAVPRVRTFSMNHMFGLSMGLLDGTTEEDHFRFYARSAEIMRPAKTFVFIAEHPGTLDDASYKNPLGSPFWSWPVNFPTGFHRGASELSFADGRSELRKWSGSRASITNTLPQYPVLLLPPVNYSWPTNRPTASMTRAWW